MPKTFTITLSEQEINRVLGALAYEAQSLIANIQAQAQAQVDPEPTQPQGENNGS